MPGQDHIDYGISGNEHLHKTLNDCAKSLMGLTTVHEVTWNVLECILHHLKCKAGAIYLLDDKKELLIQKATSKSSESALRSTQEEAPKMKIGEGVVGKVAASGQPVLQEITSASNTEQAKHAEIAVPIVGKNDQILGVIQAEHDVKGSFTEDHLYLLSEISAMMAIKMAESTHLEKMFQNQLHMDLIYDNIQDLIFLIGVEPNNVFRCVSVNQAYLDAIGLTRSNVIGKTLEEIWSDSKREFFSQKYIEAMNSGQSMTYEVTYENVSPPITTKTIITPIFDNEGKCRNISGVSRDITESKRAHTELRESKEQFENLFEYSANAIFVHDYEKITNVNQAFLYLFGYEDKSAILGRPPLETLVYPGDINLVKKLRENRAQTPTFDPNVRLLRSDGSHFIAEAHVSTVLLSGKSHLRVTVQDITRRRQAEETLSQSEEKYRALFQNSLDGIYKSTPQGRFVEVNPAMVKMLGYDSEEELKQIDILTQLYFEVEDRKIMATHLTDHYRLRRKDGSEIWVEDHSYDECDEDGNVLFHHGILRDVSGKRDKQLVLENLLAVTADQNGRLQNFAHIVSHNIRSHSSNMSSLVQLMDASENPSDKAELFEMIKTSTDKLEQTIQNLNEIITVHQNLQKPREKRNLFAEVNNTLRVLSGDIRQGKVTVDVNIERDVELEVIPAYLDSILLNLISNAIKYKSDARQAVIEISSVEKKKFIVLHVRDNGLGINMKKHRDKLFGMYETFHSKQDSRGFGLYITKNQIEAMDGKIEVDSEEGVGSDFKVYFRNSI